MTEKKRRYTRRVGFDIETQDYRHRVASGVIVKKETQKQTIERLQHELKSLQNIKDRLRSERDQFQREISIHTTYMDIINRLTYNRRGLHE